MPFIDNAFSPAEPLSGGANKSLWNPKVTQLYEYWRSIHPRAGLPGRQHFEPLDIPHLLPMLWLLDVQHEPFRLRYRLVGTMIVERLGREVTGQWLDEAHPNVAGQPKYFERYRSVVTEKQPSWRKGRPIFQQDSYVAALENLILPLTADGETVDTLLIITVRYTEDGQQY